MKMIFPILADIVVLVHFTFILFAVLGGFLVLRWKWISWIHIPCFLWAGLIELKGWICPLTPLEKILRERGGEIIYRTGFIEHYILPLLYPSFLTRQIQIVLGLFVLGINFGIYGWILACKRRIQSQT